jgi:hypothetical protein
MSFSSSCSALKLDAAEKTWSNSSMATPAGMWMGLDAMMGAVAVALVAMFAKGSGGSGATPRASALTSNPEPGAAPALALVLISGWAWSTIELSHIDTASFELGRDDDIWPRWTAAASNERSGTATESSASDHACIGSMGGGAAGGDCCRLNGTRLHESLSGIDVGTWSLLSSPMESPTPTAECRLARASRNSASSNSAGRQQSKDARLPNFFSSFSTLDAGRTASYTQWYLRFAHSSQTGLVAEHFCGQPGAAGTRSRASSLCTSGRRRPGEGALRVLDGISKYPLKLIMVDAAHLSPCPSCRRAATAGDASPTSPASSTRKVRCANLY